MMKFPVISIEAEKAGEVDLPESIFGHDPRPDILHRVVRWQLARKQQGSHKAKTRSETSYSGHMLYSQTRAGRPRHGDRNAPIFRKGGVYKGPVPRSHAHDLPRKIRQLGLKHALSAKAGADELVVLKAAEMESHRTAVLARAVARLGWGRALIIDGSDIDRNLARAAANIPGLDILPGHGANVYDILRRDTLVLTEAGLKAICERLQ